MLDRKEARLLPFGFIVVVVPQTDMLFSGNATMVVVDGFERTDIIIHTATVPTDAGSSNVPIL